MRKFFITNARGEKWDLNQTESFFSGIGGLGQEHKADYKQIGNHFIKLEDLLKQKSITGQIRFCDYDGFLAFSRFIQHKPLVMTYEAAETVSIEISIDKLDKKELETGGLFCSVTINGMSAYYKTITTENFNVQSYGKKYDYAYDYQYADFASGSVEIESDSTLDGCVRLTILGPCLNPSWTHYVNGSLVCTGKVSCSIPDGNRLVIDDTKIPYEIAEYNSKGEYVQDLYQHSDFATKRFIMLGYGNNLISFSHEGTGAIMMIVEGRVYYESV